LAATLGFVFAKSKYSTKSNYSIVSSVSHTTREQRSTEKNNVDYKFTQHEQFEQDVTHVSQRMTMEGGGEGIQVSSLQVAA
jgi:hypothetical protein